MSVVKVLVVGNSPVSREHISGLLGSDPEVQIVAFADSADNAKEKITTLSPDVAILRLELSNIGYIKSVLPNIPLPAVVVTDAATDALNGIKSGSVVFVKMPLVKTGPSMESFTNRLVEQIKASSKKKVVSASAPAPAPIVKVKDEANAFLPAAPKPIVKATEKVAPTPAAKPNPPEVKPKAELFSVKKPELPTAKSSNNYDPLDPTARAIAAATAAKQKLGVGGSITPKGRHHVIALGASTGGTDALHTVLQNLPVDTPGIVIVQHMPEIFTKMYADRLDRACKMRCVEASDGDRVEAGKIILAAGSYHLRLAKDAKGYYVTSQQGEKVSGHCPSVDVLFESVANVAGSDAIGAIFTGMGADGAVGLKKMRDAGAFTIGQDQNSCVVYGMPMVAYNLGAVCRQAPLDNIAQIILENC